MIDEKYLGKKEKRYLSIIEILASSPLSSISELAEKLGVSDETIRKDLKSEYLRNRVMQAHGSVALMNVLSGTGVPFRFRRELNAETKNEIAERACKLILPGNVVVIEHNTIGVQTLKLIAAKEELVKTVTVITNSYSILSYLVEYDIPLKTIFLGGDFVHGQLNTYGSATVAQMKELHGDIALLSPAAMNDELLITAYEENDTRFKRSVMENCRTNVLLLEHSKYNKLALRNVNYAYDYDYIITDVSLEKKQKELLSEKGTKIIETEEAGA